MASWCATLQSADDRVMQALFKAYQPVIERQGIDLRQAKIAAAQDVIPLLAQAVRLGWGPLEFFTDREFASQGACILLLDRKALAEVDRRYDIHGLWMISAPLEGQQNADMAFFLLGQGKLIVGYPRQDTVHVRDYDLWTGQYTYQPLIVMDVVNNGSHRKLANIKTLARPDSEWLPFQGPFDAEILSLEVEGEFVRVKYALLEEMTERIRKIGISPRRFRRDVLHARHWR
ncbi:MAG: hypothetical protein ACU837_16985 [Gammaproteobacteria bacterium]